MPKLTTRCNRRGHSALTGASVAFMATPRKVSFEDGHHDGASSPAVTCSSAVGRSVVSSDSPLLPSLRANDGTRALSRKSTLIRPVTSLSLVELARDSNDNNEDTSSATPAETCQANLVSPLPIEKPMMVTEESPSTLSPWGYFVDMIIPSYENIRNTSTHHNEDAPCSCCTTCRRRRACPYGDCKRKELRRPLCFLQEEHMFRTPFRLSPRKEPTDQLIGALHLMLVD